MAKKIVSGKKQLDQMPALKDRSLAMVISNNRGFLRGGTLAFKSLLVQKS